MGRQTTEMLKGVLEGIVLAILAQRPAYGYEITTWLRDQVRTWVGLTYESGATWFQLLEPDHVIEFRDDDEATP